MKFCGYDMSNKNSSYIQSLSILSEVNIDFLILDVINIVSCKFYTLERRQNSKLRTQGVLYI